MQFHSLLPFVAITTSTVLPPTRVSASTPIQNDTSIPSSTHDALYSLHHPSVRLPPYMNSSFNMSNTTSDSHLPTTHWDSPPASFLTGTWYITLTSQPSYLLNSNFQWDLWPALPTCPSNSTHLCPPGSVANVLTEITSWVPNSNSTRTIFGALGGGNRSVASISAHDTPRRLNFPGLNADWDGVYDNQITAGTPKGFRQTWAVLYWGVDEGGYPFIVVHEGVGYVATGQQNAPCLDVMGKNPEGVDEKSLRRVLRALKGLGDEELDKQVEGLAKVEWDYGLQGGPVICGERCQGNEPVSGAYMEQSL